MKNLKFNLLCIFTYIDAKPWLIKALLGLVCLHTTVSMKTSDLKSLPLN